MGANDKLAATFHPNEPEHLAAHMIDVIEYPLNGDDISVTTRARPIINALLAAAWDAGAEAAIWDERGFIDHPANPYRSTPCD